MHKLLDTVLPPLSRHVHAITACWPLNDWPDDDAHVALPLNAVHAPYVVTDAVYVHWDDTVQLCVLDGVARLEQYVLAETAVLAYKSMHA